MNKNYILIILSLILVSCELITLGNKSEPVMPIDQTSSLGAVILFKTELDSNNIIGATRILANPEGKEYLAIEKYELYDDIVRLRRIIAHKPVTLITTDTLDINNHLVNVEFDYLWTFSFTASKINNSWYIVNYARKENSL